VSSDLKVLQLHTYFLFPVSFDQDAVMDEHPEIWRGSQLWFEKLDKWVGHHVCSQFAGTVSCLGSWHRHSENSSDVKSPTYQDMMFFHPFVRRAFFDTGDANPDHEALVHRYVLHPPEGSRLCFEAEDATGHSAKVTVTDLRLLMFANGIGILNIGVEARNLSFADALWINEMMRKVYPSSAHQIETARIPTRMALVLEFGDTQQVVAEERWQAGQGLGYRPQLSAIVLHLLHFANYERGEYEPAFDERMIVKSFVSLDRSQLPDGFSSSEEYEMVFSRLLYVDQDGAGYRYQAEFEHEQMKQQVYRRWQHEGTLYGMTVYSNVTSTLALPDLSEAEGLVHRMFRTKHLLIAVIALFYRASLLGFAGESALVSRQLFPVFSGNTVRHRHIQFATRLMADFHYFNTYWFHLEPTAKDEELEHFRLLSKVYQLTPMKENIENQIDSLGGFIDRLFVLRNNDAVNRLAMMSVLLGIGALITGYFGMNIPNLEDIMKNEIVSKWTLVLTSLMTVASLWFVAYIIVSNWLDYRASIFPHRYRRPLSPKALRQLRRAGSGQDS
jgi:hypothetical protein